MNRKTPEIICLFDKFYFNILRATAWGFYMNVIKAISAPFRLAKWCVVGEIGMCRIHETDRKT